MSKKYYILIGLIIVLIFGYLTYDYNKVIEDKISINCDKFTNPVNIYFDKNYRNMAESSIKFLKPKIDSLKITAEIACSNSERQKGLMNRESLGEFNGMLFVFDYEEKYEFHMENTLIPLSIAFINAKREIVDIREMKALDGRTVTSKVPALYALELNANFFNANNIAIGDRIVINK